MSKINRLYIHVPFCLSKCDYCAFHSITSFDNHTVAVFLNKMGSEAIRLKHLTGEIESIYFGGGTPSLLTCKQLEKLFELISSNFDILKDAEISIEVNPETLTTEKAKLISGFANRISLGIQSFDTHNRYLLGRKCSDKALMKSIELITSSSISNISCDLIYGIPGQSIRDLKEDLDKAIEAGFKHISAYCLTYEENSKLIKHVCDEEKYDRLIARMCSLIPYITKSESMFQYEISNFAIKGMECRHNLNIWYGSKYLGLGPAAASYDGINRWTNPDLTGWLGGQTSLIDDISSEERVIEIFIMGLRTTAGWNITVRDKTISFRDSYSGIGADFNPKTWNAVNKSIIELNKLNYLNIEYQGSNIIKVYPTEHGLLFWNEIGIELIQ